MGVSDALASAMQPTPAEALAPDSSAGERHNLHLEAEAILARGPNCLDGTACSCTATQWAC
eukprot:15056343-Alexandrium_andersonii.AAC.1